MDPSNKLLAINLLSESRAIRDQDDSDLLAIFAVLLLFLPDSQPDPLDDIDFISQLTLDDFRQQFGVQRRTFQLLHGLFNRNGNDSSDIDRKIPRSKQLLSTLRFCASQESLSTLATRFDVCESNLLVCIRTVAEWMNNSVKKIFVRWPRGKRADQVEESFKKQANLPGILGAIGCIKVQINIQQEDHCYFKDQGCCRAIALQLIALPNLMFSDVYCAPPGVEDERRVMESSPLFQILRTNPESLFPDEWRLVGSEAYSQTPRIATPFIDRGYLTRDQKAFNKRHDKAHAIVAKSVENLSARWKRIQVLELKNVDLVTELLIACCVLHNICCLTEDEVQTMIERSR